MDKYKIFINAINQKLIVKVRINTIEKGIIERQCVPFDYGLGARIKDGLERYHFYDLDSPEGKHNLSILPSQLIEITLTGKTFEPGDYVTWKAIKWIVKRDWGVYS